MGQRGPALARDEAVAELARRYFRSRGPATLDDFVWWSGLTTSDARAGVEAVKGSLAVETFEGRAFYRAGDARPHGGKGEVHLLPAFDEWLVAYRDRGAVLDPAHATRLNAGGGMLDPCVVHDGEVIATWKRVLAKKTVAIEIDVFDAKARVRRAAIEGAAQRYADFVGLAPTITFA